MGFQELVTNGMGWRTLPPSARAAGRELGWAGRTRARFRMRRGTPGWDATSALYQTALGHQAAGMKTLFGPRGTVIVGAFIVIAFASEAVSSYGDDGISFRFAFFVVFGAFMAFAFATYRSTLRNAARVDELNGALLDGRSLETTWSSEPPKGRRRALSLAVTFLYLAVVYALMTKWIFASDRAWGEVAGQAAVWALFTVALMQWIGRRKGDRKSPGASAAD